MNFDYEYEETPKDAFVDLIHQNTALFIIIVAVLVIILLAVAFFFLLRSGKIQIRSKKLISQNASGYVFCPKCNNRFYLVTDKCPYCKQRRLRL